MKQALRTTIIFGVVALGASTAAAEDKSGLEADARGALALPAASGEADPLLPTGAKPGECYARAFIPAQYVTNEEKILKSDASSTLEVIPAKIEAVEERVIVKGPSTRLEIIPAQFETVTERVLVKPETKRLEVVPAKYETVSEQVLDKPAHSVWKKGRGPVEKVNDGTGEIMCLVTVPAEYKTVQQRKLISPASTVERVTPAEYVTIKKEVMKTPPTTREVEIPAEYKTVKILKEIEPARTVKREIPAEYQTVAKTAKIAEGRMEWRPVLCETNFDLTSISALQRALSIAGFDPGPVDGRLAEKTSTALRSYQRAKGLAVGGLTIETLNKLGVKYKSSTETSDSDG